jgi:adenylate cyclase, class 2
VPTNLEIKAAYPSAATAKKHAIAIGGKFAGTLAQIDTYYKVGSGRLKLRVINGKRAELIYYQRANTKRSRYSNYTVLELPNATSAGALFQSLFGIWKIVRKKRVLFLYQNARIHIDTVKGLGTFIEFEVIVNLGRKQARALMLFLRKQFVVESNSVIAGSYSDMIQQR